jgi:hypothetical protein
VSGVCNGIILCPELQASELTANMPKRSPREKLFEWRITRIRATPARLIGYVQAADAEQAVKEAIARYGIDNPQEQAGWPHSA